METLLSFKEALPNIEQSGGADKHFEIEFDVLAMSESAPTGGKKETKGCGT